MSVVGSGIEIFNLDSDRHMLEMRLVKFPFYCQSLGHSATVWDFNKTDLQVCLAKKVCMFMRSRFLMVRTVSGAEMLKMQGIKCCCAFTPQLVTRSLVW